jgi:hypothetical protein
VALTHRVDADGSAARAAAFGTTTDDAAAGLLREMTTELSALAATEMASGTLRTVVTPVLSRIALKDRTRRIPPS